VQVADVEAADPLLRDLVVADVTVVAADLLIAAGAESVLAGPGEDDCSDFEVVAGASECVAQLGQRLGPKGVSALRPVDRDLGQAVALLVEDVAVLAGALPVDRCVQLLLRWGVLVALWHAASLP